MPIGDHRTHISLSEDPLHYMKSVDKQLSFLHPGAFPMLIACAGRDAQGRRLALITNEYPEPIRFRREKETGEEHHLERFRADYRHATRTDPFDGFRRGPDPPDFLVSRGTDEVGLDVTQMVLRQRVEAHEGLQELRQAALMCGRKVFRRLHGYILQVSLVDRSGNWKPMIEKTLDAFALLDPRPRRTDVWHPDLSSGAETIVRIGDDEGWATAGPLREALAASFYGVMGFDIAQAFPTLVSATEAWELLQTLVARHDKPGNEELLVSCGAPVGGGFAFPSDIVTGSLVIDEADAGSILQAAYVKKVYLHSWLVRSIHVLEPGKPGTIEVASGAEAIEDLSRGFYAPDAEPHYDWDAQELQGTNLADIFVREHTLTGERQVFVRTDEIRDGLPVWRRDDSGIGGVFTTESKA
jgi:hypothetical protein